MNDLENSIALLFRKKGKSSLTEKEFVFSASMDYRWFKPKEAQRLLDLGIEVKLLESVDGMISPTFDHKSINVPKHFKPTPQVLQIQPAPKGTFLEIVDYVSKEKKIPRQEIIAMMNKRQEIMRMNVEVAALMTAYELGVDINSFIKKVETGLMEQMKR